MVRLTSKVDGHVSSLEIKGSIFPTTLPCRGGWNWQTLPPQKRVLERAYGFESRSRYMTKIQEAASIIMAKCRDNNAGGTEQAQIMALAEEAGEFVGAMRRWREMARRKGTQQEAEAELADVVITAYGMADVMGWDLDKLISDKLEKVMTRGWKELS